MRTTGTIILNAYIAVILVALVWFPLIVLHGYREWWLVTFYAVVATATIGGIASHYRMVWRSRKAAIQANRGSRPGWPGARPIREPVQGPATAGGAD